MSQWKTRRESGLCAAVSRGGGTRGATHDAVCSGMGTSPLAKPAGTGSGRQSREKKFRVRIAAAGGHPARRRVIPSAVLRTRKPGRHARGEERWRCTQVLRSSPIAVHYSATHVTYVIAITRSALGSTPPGYHPAALGPDTSSRRCASSVSLSILGPALSPRHRPSKSVQNRPVPQRVSVQR